MTYYISAKRFYFENKIKEGGYLAVVDGRLGDWTEKVPEGAEVLDYSNYQIAPGLVDTHIHGFVGYDVMDNSEELVPKFKDFSVKDLISLKPIRGLKILNTWTIQVWNN